MTRRRHGLVALAFGLVFLVAAPAGAEETARPIGDAARAERELWQTCAGCHQIGEGAGNAIGPHLNGIFGRTAGSVEGFAYSEGLRRAGRDGLVWDIERLEAYLANPRIIVSRTNMAFPGFPDPQDRADMVAYLRTFSDNPRDIPEAAPTALAEEVVLTDEQLALVGDPEYGAYLSSECTTCHLADGGYEGIPSITLWDERDFVLALQAYKQKIRPHPVMQMIAGRLGDEEIAALAAYFAGLDG